MIISKTAPKLWVSFILSFSAMMAAINVHAGEADIVQVKARDSADNIWRFSVTLRHEDTGWEHYADNWDILAPDGRVIQERVLAHPHIHEQPFTRSLSGVAILKDISYVIIRGRDTVHGHGGQLMRYDLQTGATQSLSYNEIFDDDLSSKPRSSLGNNDD